MSRLQLLCTAIALMIVATACGTGDSNSEAAGDATGAEEEAGGATTLDFAVWTYDLTTTQALLDEFQAYSASQDPAIDVEIQLSEAGFGEFDTHVTSLNSAGNEFDVLYGSDHWLAKWAQAGWILPVDEHCPELDDYSDDIAEFSLSGMTQNGQLYGLPYYSDVMYFVRNTAMLEDAGFSEAPGTWEEVVEQAQAVKDQGISEDPFMLGLTIDSWFEEELYALIYSRGGDLFDDEFNATFETDSGPFYDTLEWLRSAVRDTEIMPQRAIQMSIQDVQLAFQSGDTTFALVAGYMMADFASSESAVAGDYAIQLMPGSTQETAGFTRTYSLGSGALEDETTRQAACRFIDFHGGSTEADGEDTYQVAKTWAVQNGLGFSAESLWDDPEVQEAFGEFADIDVLREQKALARAKDGMDAPWFAEWMSFVRTEVQSVLLGEQETEPALERIKEQWTQLAAA